jgi:hypothetical protein
MSCLTKIAHFGGFPWPLAVAFLLLCGVPLASAQQTRSPVRILEISSQTQETPRYDVSRTEGISSRGRSGRWMVVKVVYETAPDWIDELKVTFYVQVENPQADRRSGRGADLVLRGAVSYVDVEEGEHQAVMAMQPSTLTRYGDPVRLAVEISVGGQVVAQMSDPSARSPWWSQMPSRDGCLVTRLASPWAMLYFDEFEAIKGSTDRR